MAVSTGRTWQQGEETGTIATKHWLNCGGMWGRESAARKRCSPCASCLRTFSTRDREACRGFAQFGPRSYGVPDEVCLLKEVCGQDPAGCVRNQRLSLGHGWHSNGTSALTKLPEVLTISSRIFEAAATECQSSQKRHHNLFLMAPESFTPMTRYYLGEAPEVTGYWVAAGYKTLSGSCPPVWWCRYGAGATG